MRIALAGDTMLGRGVGDRLLAAGPRALFADELVAVAGEADAFVLNLECAISGRGERWPARGKPFFFRAPPIAVEALALLGVDCVTLANNHALDYGVEALLDTLEHLTAAGIAVVGAGHDERAARAPALVERAGVRVGVVGVTDHPRDFAAAAHTPGVAYADLRRGTPAWLTGTIADLAGEPGSGARGPADVVVVTPHWGPNLVPAPLGYVRAAAAQMLTAGATLVAGHSAHVFQGVGDRVIYDLGDLVDDYARDPELRNDLGALFLVDVDPAGASTGGASGPARVVGLEVVPLALAFAHTRLADRDEAAWIAARLRRASAPFGTEVVERRGRLVIEWDSHPARRPVTGRSAGVGTAAGSDHDGEPTSTPA